MSRLTNARRVIISKVKSGVRALHRNQSPGAYQLLASIVGARFSGEQENAREDQQDDAAVVHGRLVYSGRNSLLAWNRRLFRAAAGPQFVSEEPFCQRCRRHARTYLAE